MGLKFVYEEGQTPLNKDEKVGLLIKTISTQGELDEHEQRNIEKAIEWTIHNKFRTESILTEKFIKKLHVKMFSDTWRWAGDFRQSEKNIGVDWITIPVALRTLLDDTKYWIENETFPPDELAIRFKHRLVNIHCFPNGNGRHSRIMADIIIQSIFKKEIFSWHNSNMVRAGEVRSKYIKAIRIGDSGNINPLIEFARG